jgi:hypothetical protein
MKEVNGRSGCHYPVKLFPLKPARCVTLYPGLGAILSMPLMSLM